MAEGESAAVIAAGAGVLLSAILHVVLQQWEIARFGLIDPDMVGSTAGLFGVLIGQATALFGVLIAPRDVRVWPTAMALSGALVGGLIVAGNLPGLRDGIRSESWPLAIWVGLSGIYFIASAVAAVVVQLKEE